ncbi:TIGR03086 family protein [Serinicoccus sp. CNJ-927]|uniref:TIGR03086 family metal-binding protein n=1 Tax=Serinicoccus sp. CNJ-927 TaxID=1904970 RepID=UPI00095CA9C5|nr:TIGR03086 family metal-binding protein [Serinicoccus sp. CNJ-927]OLT40289.1 TIGR03086 family protein [Serinicoccus sp. CNJ-927]
MTQQPDLRPVLARTQEWVADLVDGVRADQMQTRTPCAQWDVAELVEHLFAVEHRVAVLPVKGTVDDEPVAIPLPKDVSAGFRDAVRRAQDAWADDAVMDAQLSPPWGTMPGRAVLGGYVQEHLVHGWDLASATGQDGEALAEVSEQVLPMIKEFLPAQTRSEDWIPFDAPVEPASDAGPTERLANWLGRTTR